MFEESPDSAATAEAMKTMKPFIVELKTWYGLSATPDFLGTCFG